MMAKKNPTAANKDITALREQLDSVKMQHAAVATTHNVYSTQTGVASEEQLQQRLRKSEAVLGLPPLFESLRRPYMTLAFTTVVRTADPNHIHLGLVTAVNHAKNNFLIIFFTVSSDLYMTRLASFFSSRIIAT